jgi:hypothetical protein
MHLESRSATVLGPMATKAPNPEIISVRLGALTNSELADLNDVQLGDELERTGRIREALAGRTAQLAGEIARRQAFRVVGATSIETYLVGQLGISRANARALAHVGERLFDLSDLQAALSTGEISFDKVRVIADVADPDTDAEWVEAAASLPVAELAELADRSAAKRRLKPGCGRRPERPTLRRNDAVGTLTARLPQVEYAEACARLEAEADLFRTDGETPYDERLGDALMSLLRGHAQVEGSSSAQNESSSTHKGSSSAGKGSPYLVVAHVRLNSLLSKGESGTQGKGQIELGAELERGGLISIEVARRLACDGALVVALDDEAGHTMYEGRARRFATETQRRELWRRDRHCRFPGCSHRHFIHAHHVVPWKPGGRTDLENLVVLCSHHHHAVHSNAWSVSGNANEVLTFIGPSGRVMTSSPSPLWGSIGDDPTQSTTTAGDVRKLDPDSG